MAYIIIADDDDILAELISSDLQSAGHDVSVAGDGSEVVRMARAKRPDAIILDQSMPIKSGLDVLYDLRRHPQFVSTPVMMLTAHNDGEIVTSAMQFGAQDYMTKPFNPQALAVRIEMLLRSEPGRTNECFM